MKIIVQRVIKATVSVNNNVVGKISQGLLLLVGIENRVEEQESRRMEKIAEKILKLRIFGDKNEKMNLSIMDIKGEILVIPQFTLLADTSGGNRPYFGNAALAKIAKPIFDHFVEELKKSNLKVETGIFGAKMKIEAICDGPVTIILES